jgi:hypothetical protein
VIWDGGPMWFARRRGSIPGGSSQVYAYKEADRKMRGAEQHVERKIRLWVVQQERVRLMNGQRGAIDARADELLEPPGPAVDGAAPER